MKNNTATNFTGWAFIASALMLFFGWLLSSHQLGEYIVSSDFEEINKNLWYWIWIYRIHIFGWVIMALAAMALGVLLNQKPSNVVVLPSVGVLAAGSFILALAHAFYYSFGAYGVGETLGKSPEEVTTFMNSIKVLNHYVTCLVRFGRVFSGVGLTLLGIAIYKWNLMDKWLGVFTSVLGILAMAIIMGIPDNYEIYKPMFHVKVVWLLTMGGFILLKGVNISNSENTK